MGHFHKVFIPSSNVPPCPVVLLPLWQSRDWLIMHQSTFLLLICLYLALKSFLRSGYGEVVWSLLGFKKLPLLMNPFFALTYTFKFWHRNKRGTHSKKSLDFEINGLFNCRYIHFFPLSLPTPDILQEQNDHIVYRMPNIDIIPPPCPGRTPIYHPLGWEDNKTVFVCFVTHTLYLECPQVVCLSSLPLVDISSSDCPLTLTSLLLPLFPSSSHLTPPHPPPHLSCYTPPFSALSCTCCMILISPAGSVD